MKMTPTFICRKPNKRSREEKHQKLKRGWMSSQWSNCIWCGTLHLWDHVTGWNSPTTIQGPRSTPNKWRKQEDQKYWGWSSWEPWGEHSWEQEELHNHRTWCTKVLPCWVAFLVSAKPWLNQKWWSLSRSQWTMVWFASDVKALFWKVQKGSTTGS